MPVEYGRCIGQALCVNCALRPHTILLYHRFSAPACMTIVYYNRILLCHGGTHSLKYNKCKYNKCICVIENHDLYDCRAIVLSVHVIRVDTENILCRFVPFNVQ